MGIRIHKAIGYGFDDVRVADGKIDDERIKKDATFYMEDESIQEFIALLNDRDRCQAILSSTYKYHEDDVKLSCIMNVYAIRELEGRLYSNLTVANNEFFPGVVLFIPPERPRWFRFDDTIDYYEANCRESLDNYTVNLFEESSMCGFYPFEGMELKPGRETDVHKRFSWIRHPRKLQAGEYNRLVGRWASDVEPLVKDEALLQHLKEDWSIAIPDTVKLLEYHLDILHNPLDIYEFKPLLCEWWS